MLLKCCSNNVNRDKKCLLFFKVDFNSPFKHSSAWHSDFSAKFGKQSQQARRCSSGDTCLDTCWVCRVFSRHHLRSFQTREQSSTRESELIASAAGFALPASSTPLPERASRQAAALWAGPAGSGPPLLLPLSFSPLLSLPSAPPLAAGRPPCRCPRPALRGGSRRSRPLFVAAGLAAAGAGL